VGRASVPAQFEQAGRDARPTKAETRIGCNVECRADFLLLRQAPLVPRYFSIGRLPVSFATDLREP